MALQKIGKTPLGLVYHEVNMFLEMLIKANDQELSVMGGAILSEIKKRKQARGFGGR